MLHRGNMPQQGGAVEGCQKRIYFLLNDQNLRAKNRKEKRGKRKEERGKRKEKRGKGKQKTGNRKQKRENRKEDK